MNSWMTRAGGSLALTAVLLAGCGGVSAVTKELEALGAAGTVAGSLEVLEQLDQAFGRTKAEMEQHLRSANP